MLKEPKHRVLAIMFASVMLAGATQSSDAIAETREVEIIATDDGFFFKEGDVNIEIQKGDTVVWIVRAGTHFLVADKPADAFKPTGDFNQNTKPLVDHTFDKFDKTTKVEYHCERHKTTMIGTINVKVK